MKLSKSTLDHIKSHVKYPVSKAALLKECDNWSDVPAAERKAAESLPDKTFTSSNDVLRALGS